MQGRQRTGGGTQKQVSREHYAAVGHLGAIIQDGGRSALHQQAQSRGYGKGCSDDRV